jgi:hypothetical protein
MSLATKPTTIHICQCHLAKLLLCGTLVHNLPQMCILLEQSCWFLGWVFTVSSSATLPQMFLLHLTVRWVDRLCSGCSLWRYLSEFEISNTFLCSVGTYLFKYIYQAIFSTHVSCLKYCCLFWKIRLNPFSVNCSFHSTVCTLLTGKWITHSYYSTTTENFRLLIVPNSL